MTNENEMKPCPFCGGEAMIQFQIAGYCGARVSCVECDAETGGYKVKGDNDAADAQAVTAWNTRTDLHDATKAQLAECEARLHKAMEALRHCCEDIEKGWLAIPDIEEKFNTDNSWHAVQHAHAVMAEVEKGEKK